MDTAIEIWMTYILIANVRSVISIEELPVSKHGIAEKLLGEAVDSILDKLAHSNVRRGSPGIINVVGAKHANVDQISVAARSLA